MNIDHSRELLYDYARGRLSEQDCRIVEEQLQGSENLRDELEKVKTYYTAIDEADPVRLPEHFLENVHKRIDLRGKRGLLSRLFSPLHLKLPIEFAGVAATVALVIFIFIPQLEKKNYSEYEPVHVDNVQQEPPALQKPIAGKSVEAVSTTEETADRGQINAEKKENSVNKDELPVSRIAQQSKSSVPKQDKSSPMKKAGVKRTDDVPQLPAAELLSENVPPAASIPTPAPAPARQMVTENNEIGTSEHVSAMAPAVQEDEQQKSFNESEAQTTVSKRKVTSFERMRMKSRSENAEKSEVKEIASSMDFEMATGSKDVTAVLEKCGMKWVVKEFAGGTTNCSVSGTPASVTQFLREIKKLPDITLRRVIPENYSAALDSVVVEFSVKGNLE